MRPEQILELAAEKLSQRVIAERLGTSKTTVARVLRESSRHAAGPRPEQVAALS